MSFGWRFLTPVLLGPMLNPLNTSMIAVALVPIGCDLHIPTATTIWLVAGLYLASAVAQPTLGRMADLIGARRVYLTGLTVTLLAGLIPTLWHSFPGVLAARLLIGIGTSASYPAALSLIRDHAADFGIPAPPGVLSALSISAQGMTALGPVLGGVLIAVSGWPSIFLVNVPLAAITLVTTLLWVPADAGPHHRTAGSLRTGLDAVGILLFATTVTALLFFLLHGSRATLWLLPVAAAGGVMLVLWERHRAEPFLDVRALVANPALTRTYARQFLTYLSAYTMMYGFSQWVQTAGGFSGSQAGYLQLPTAVLAALTGLVVARTTRLRAPLVASGLVPFAGALLILAVHSSSPVWLLVIVTGLFGIPQGLASVGNQAALFRQAPEGQLGVASGLSRTAVYLGAIVSSAFIGLAFPATPTDGGLHLLAPLILVVSALTAILALRDRTLRTPAAV
ncbi:MFS transporter [Winogradskya consettensis]|nr:MFS transporter [Actinoplanes consettensis]